jgi:molybdenum-dependent DNA-binding transcriptional regulator ModE
MESNMEIKTKVWLEKEGELVFGTGRYNILTDYAKELLEKFERVEKKVRIYADKCYKEIFKEK